MEERIVYKYLGGDVTLSPAGHTVRIDDATGRPKEVTWKNRVVVTEGSNRSTISKSAILKIAELCNEDKQFVDFVKSLED